METQLKACVTAVVVLCVTFAAAYEIQATHLNVAATSRTSGSWLWRPHHAINFNDEGIAVKVSHGPAHCTESTASLRPIGLAGKALNRSLQECPVGVLMSGDGGLTWEPAQVGPYFCGSLGTLRNSKLYCPGQRVTKVPASLEKEFRSRLAAEDKKDPKKAPVRHQLEDRPLVVYEEWEYELIQMTDDDDTKAKRRLAQAAGESFATTNAVIRERTTGNYVAYDQTVFASSVKDIRLGGAVLWLPERQLHLRNVELTLENTTKLHAFYRSVDGGSFWTFVSFVPVDFSAFTVMLRLSDTRVQLISGEIGNMNQTSSLFLGNKWEKSEKAPFVMPSSYYQGRYQSMVASGVVPRPSLGLVAIGTKKNSQQSLLLSAIHNNATQWYKDEIPSPLTPKNYSKDFALATTYDCIGEGAANTPAAGCECSGFIAVVAANANNSVVVLYDRLVAGHRPTAHKGDHTIFALRLYMNETVEQEEYELKLAQEAKAKQQEKEAELLAAKRREELRLKKEKDAADKKRRNKARRAEWKKLDEGAQRLAKQYESLDGQWIVVRPALDEYVDIEKEMF